MQLDSTFSSKHNNIEFITMDENEVKKFITKLFKEINKEANVTTYLKNNYKSDKEFNRALMFTFIDLLKMLAENNGDHIFVKASTYIKDKSLEKLLLQLLYKDGLDSGTRIKMIKNFETTLPNLIYTETILYNFLRYLYINGESIEEIAENDIYFDEKLIDHLIGLVTYLNLITVIKVIKFGLSKADIAYFDKSNRAKKIFKSYKVIGVTEPSRVIKLFDPDLIDYKYLSEYIRDSKFTKNDDMWSSVLDEIVFSFMIYENNMDYTKYLLGEEYHSIITNPIIHNQTNVTRSFINRKVLNKRKVLVPKSGVVIKVEGDSDIDSILIKEIENDFDNNLVIVTRDRSGDEWVNTFPLSLSILTGQVFFDKKGLNASTLDYVFDFLGVFDDETVDVDKESDLLTKDLSYEVISPYYWKYRGLYTAPEDKVDSKGVVIERAYEIDIAHFIRKTKGEAGKDAKELAKRLCVELKEGQTIVRAHTRQYKRKKLVL